MNHLDDLRDALQSPPGFVAGELDLGAIMAAGGRRRRVHRLAASAAAGLAVAVLPRSRSRRRRQRTGRRARPRCPPTRACGRRWAE
jgi:hypothetical protein